MALSSAGALLIGSAVLPLMGQQSVRADATHPLQTAESAAPEQPEPAAFHDVLLASGVRLLFQVTVEHVDLEKLKANAIEKIRAKDEEDYRRQMNRIFDDLESVEVDEVLGVSRASSRKDVIAVLEQTDKQALLGAMNEISDESIADLVERKLREKGESSLAGAHDYLEAELTEFVAGLSG